MSDLLSFHPFGIYCKQANVFIDPWKKVDRALITHAHSDHARQGSINYLAHPITAAIMRHRLGNVNVQTIAYQKSININGVEITFFPAGHIPGSSQIRLSYQNQTWVVSGDYKVYSDGISEAFEPIKCSHFITESTFGLPVFNFSGTQQNIEKTLSWIEENKNRNYNTVLCGYSLGKAQRIIALLNNNQEIWLHKEIYKTTEILVNEGVNIPNFKNCKELLPEEIPKIKGGVVVVPPGALESKMVKMLEPLQTAYFSGWMHIRGNKNRLGVDLGVSVSDHADWPSLNKAVIETGAENVYVTHGFKKQFSKWLCEKHHLNAVDVETLFEGETMMSKSEAE